MKRAVKRNRRGVTIDVLQLCKERDAGTLSAEDSRIVNRVVPGLLDALPKKAEPTLSQYRPWNGLKKPDPRQLSLSPETIENRVETLEIVGGAGGNRTPE